MFLGRTAAGYAPAVRALALLVMLSACGVVSASDPPKLDDSRPHDPDLDLGATCPGGPAAESLLATLPDYVKELVVLWPRAGCTRDGGLPAARMTLVNHQGEVLTLTVLLRARGVTAEASDFQVLTDGGAHRAELELAPSPAHPHVLVRVAGAPATPREGLEGPGDFLDLPALVAAFDALL